MYMLPVGYESGSFERVASNTFLHEIVVNDLAVYWLGDFPDDIQERNAAHCWDHREEISEACTPYLP